MHLLLNTVSKTASYIMYPSFQEKRLKKDAGRQRWSPYLRQMKKNGDPDNSLSADERSDDGLTDYHGNIIMYLLQHLFIIHLFI